MEVQACLPTGAATSARSSGCTSATSDAAGSTSCARTTSRWPRSCMHRGKVARLLARDVAARALCARARRAADHQGAQQAARGLRLPADRPDRARRRRRRRARGGGAALSPRVFSYRKGIVLDRADRASSPRTCARTARRAAGPARPGRLRAAPRRRHLHRLDPDRPRLAAVADARAELGCAAASRRRGGDQRRDAACPRAASVTPATGACRWASRSPRCSPTSTSASSTARSTPIPGGFYARYGDDFLFAHPDPAVARAPGRRHDQRSHRLSLTVNAQKRPHVYLTAAGRPSAEWPGAQGAPAVPFLGTRMAADGTVGLDPPKVRGAAARDRPAHRGDRARRCAAPTARRRPRRLRRGQPRARPAQPADPAALGDAPAARRHRPRPARASSTTGSPGSSPGADRAAAGARAFRTLPYRAAAARVGPASRSSPARNAAPERSRERARPAGSAARPRGTQRLVAAGGGAARRPAVALRLVPAALLLRHVPGRVRRARGARARCSSTAWPGADFVLVVAARGGHAARPHLWWGALEAMRGEVRDLHRAGTAAPDPGRGRRLAGASLLLAGGVASLARGGGWTAAQLAAGGSDAAEAYVGRPAAARSRSTCPCGLLPLGRLRAAAGVQAALRDARPELAGLAVMLALVAVRRASGRWSSRRCSSAARSSTALTVALHPPRLSLPRASRPQPDIATAGRCAARGARSSSGGAAHAADGAGLAGRARPAQRRAGPTRARSSCSSSSMPTIRAGAEWARLLYFDFKRLELRLFTQPAPALRAPQRAAGVVLGVLFWAVAALVATLVLRRRGSASCTSRCWRSSSPARRSRASRSRRSRSGSTARCSAPAGVRRRARRRGGWPGPTSRAPRRGRGGHDRLPRPRWPRPAGAGAGAASRVPRCSRSSGCAGSARCARARADRLGAGGRPLRGPDPARRAHARGAQPLAAGAARRARRPAARRHDGVGGLDRPRPASSGSSTATGTSPPGWLQRASGGLVVRGRRSASCPDGEQACWHAAGTGTARAAERRTCRRRSSRSTGPRRGAGSTSSCPAASSTPPTSRCPAELAALPGAELRAIFADATAFARDLGVRRRAVALRRHRAVRGRRAGADLRRDPARSGRRARARWRQRATALNVRAADRRAACRAATSDGDAPPARTGAVTDRLEALHRSALFATSGAASSARRRGRWASARSRPAARSPSKARSAPASSSSTQRTRTRRRRRRARSASSAPATTSGRSR